MISHIDSQEIEALRALKIEVDSGHFTLEINLKTQVAEQDLLVKSIDTLGPESLYHTGYKGVTHPGRIRKLGLKILSDTGASTCFVDGNLVDKIKQQIPHLQLKA